jgi:hypothetical protein
VTPSKAPFPRASALGMAEPISPAGPLARGKPNSVGLFFCAPGVRRIAAGSARGLRLRQLWAEYPRMSRQGMGFPNDRERSQIWPEVSSGN